MNLPSVSVQASVTTMPLVCRVSLTRSGGELPRTIVIWPTIAPLSTCPFTLGQVQTINTYRALQRRRQNRAHKVMTSPLAEGCQQVGLGRVSEPSRTTARQSLERQLQSKLQLARVKRARGLAERTNASCQVSNLSIDSVIDSTWQLEVGMVENIEALSSELQCRPFPAKLEDLEQRDIRVEEVWTHKLVASFISITNRRITCVTIAGTLEETPGSSIAKRVGRAPTICPHIVRGIYVLLLHINSVS